MRRGAVLALALAGALVMPAANAQRHGGGWHGGPGIWGLGLGLGLGWEIANAGGYYPYGYYGYPAYPAYAYPYPYPYPYVAAAPAPYPVPAPAAAPQYQSQAANWYYCDSARGYYPYVAQCAEGWRAVPSVPPGAVR